MAAYVVAAMRAAPRLFLFLQKCRHAFCADEFEVFNHAQMIFRLIALIQSLQAFTGEGLAFITKIDSTRS